MWRSIIMNNSNEIIQITENVFCKTENDIMKFYEASKRKLGEIRRQLDKVNKVLKYSDFKKESEDFSTNLLSEILNLFIESANIMQLNELIIESFPIDIETFNQVAKVFTDLYPKAINISYEKKDTDESILKICVQFKNPRITHYVQQAYLRNFSSNKNIWKESGKNDKARIYCYDKEMSSVITIGNTKIEREQGVKINRMAYREYYYSLRLEMLMRHTFERIIPPVIEKIINKKSLNEVAKKERFALSQYIILSWARTVEAREFIRESLEKSILEFSKMEFGSQELEGLKVKFDETYLRMMHEDQIMRFLFPEKGPPLAVRLARFEWGLIKTRRPEFFLTSDTPVVFHNSFIEKQIKQKGKKFFIEEKEKELRFIKSKRAAAYNTLTSPNKYKRPGVRGVEIYLPLNSKLCLCLVDKMPGFKSLNVKQINKLMILDCERYLYSQYNELDFIEKIIKKHPECIDKTGKRSIVKSTILDKVGKRQGKKFTRFEAVGPPK